LIGTQTFNYLAMKAGGRPVVEIKSMLDGIAAKPTAPEYWWVYGLLLTTLVPSVLNLIVGGASLMCGAPWIPLFLLKYMPRDGAPASHNQTWMALTWTVHIVGGILLGISVQIFLIVMMIAIIMPAIGLNLLEMCRVVYLQNLPAVLF